MFRYATFLKNRMKKSHSTSCAHVSSSICFAFGYRVCPLELVVSSVTSCKSRHPSALQTSTFASKDTPPKHTDAKKTVQSSSQDKWNCAGYSQGWDDSEWQTAVSSGNWQSWVKNEGWGSDWNQNEIAATGSLNDSQWQHGNGFTKMETWGPEWNQENESHAAPKTSKRKEPMPTIEESMGMNLHDRHPKTAVREFLTRYLGRDLTRDDCHYSCQEEASRFRAKLHVPIWKSGVFEGERCDSQKEAETSAALCFLEDDDVIEAAPRLPAPVRVIKYWERLNKFNSQKKGCRTRIDPDDLMRQYNDQREQGCRMAVWDGRV